MFSIILSNAVAIGKEKFTYSLDAKSKYLVYICITALFVR